MIIVDSQVHVWKPPTPERPWDSGPEASMPHLPEPLTIEALRNEMAGADVGRSVLIAPSWEGLRNDYVAEAYDRYPAQFRYMGRLDLEAPEARSRLPEWMKAPGILGMRLVFMRKHDRVKLLAGGYDWLWADCERYGVPLMIMAVDARPKWQDIAARHPGLTLIVDHMGFSAGLAKERRLAEATSDTIALARFPNVSVKLSAVPAYSHEPYPFNDMHGHLHRVIDAYGPQRCYWGTDLSQMQRICSYRDCVTMFTEALGLSAAELEWIMGRGFCEKLGWPLPA